MGQVTLLSAFLENTSFHIFSYLNKYAFLTGRFQIWNPETPQNCATIPFPLFPPAPSCACAQTLLPTGPCSVHAPHKNLFACPSGIRAHRSSLIHPRKTDPGKRAAQALQVGLGPIVQGIWDPGSRSMILERCGLGSRE